MNILNKSYLALAVAALFMSCDAEKSLPNRENPMLNLAYIGEATTSSSIRFQVGDDGGQTNFTPRITTPIKDAVQLKVIVDKELLASYNKENNSNFQLLPDANYDLVVGEQKGKELTLDLAPSQFGQVVTVKVKNMLAADGTTLPLSTNYVVPVRLVSVSGGGVEYKDYNTKLMIFMDRKFKTNVLNYKGWILYKHAQGRFENKEWTMQYSFSPNVLASSMGLIWPEGENLKSSRFWTQMESDGSFIIHATSGGGGKYGFNQKKFEDFHFEAGKWYNMAITYKEDANAVPTLRIYVNGELAFKSKWPGLANEWDYIALGNDNFDALVRELRFWSRELSATEVASTQFFADPAAKGLELYAPLDKVNGVKNIVPGKEGAFISKLKLNGGDLISSEGYTFNFNKEVSFPN